jgi:septal ring factor EnvC (AmiA/AmiB activator)
MPEWLLPLLPSTDAIFGGSAVAGITAIAAAGRKAWQTYASTSRKDNEQQHELSRKMRNELKAMLDEERSERKALAKRVDQLEQRLDEEKGKRLEAERHNKVLQQKLDLVIQLLNDMREEQGKNRLSTEDLTLLALDRNGRTAGDSNA